MTNKINYTQHLQTRLKARKIPKDYPKKILLKPEQKFLDTQTGTMIATKKLYYNKKQDKTSIITIHPITEEKIINRIIKKRWIRT